MHNTSSFAHYWREGIGVTLLAKLGKALDLEQAEQHIPLFYQADREGDQLVTDVHLKFGFAAGNRMLADYLGNRGLSQHVRLIFDDFFAKIDVNPTWLDWDLLQVGQELCQRPGLTSLIVLRDYCLMGGYESAAINKPLVYTGALKKGAVKRLTDTVEFWVNITKPGNLGFRENGFQEIILTRFIHSFSRIKILEKTEWETEKWGVPLNTWDMLATHLGFTQVFLVGLRKMGINPTAREVAGLFHFWKYVGYLLGIPLSLLPANEAEAIEQLYYWTMTQRDGDEDSRNLAHALQEEPVHAFYPKTALMRKMMREIHLFYNHYLLGDFSCEVLGLAKTTVGRLAMANVWRNRRQERAIQSEQDRVQFVKKGAAEQEHVRQIYQQYNKST
ncbi:DUF2236 domain-containing protein [Sphingobacterium psychroaquaticum]|uniref:oxygenase MpaB family protein n=1 Tax=Sphingobacterium psychroaquaticum TaxID=561061 RepID=UPI00106C8601|nr:oxygenase MpaB family protein [Sphingobacterium psychroaquaticum]QBQ40849.1 DUF2236 domain-containing protein [Sphingobacterium psychroaquaticum]